MMRMLDYSLFVCIALLYECWLTKFNNVIMKCIAVQLIFFIIFVYVLVC